MDTLLYTIGNNLYLNTTNRCPCACTFCVRQETDTLGDAGSLWLKDGEHPVEEYIQQFKERDLDHYQEIIFCGYGEPTERLADICAMADYLKAHTKTPIRLNTNGLSDLIYGRDTTPDLDGRFDAVSVSLNAPDAQHYLEITNSRFGIESFDAMLRFTQNAKAHVPYVQMSIVDVLSPEDTKKCQEICDKIGVHLRIRLYA